MLVNEIYVVVGSKYCPGLPQGKSICMTLPDVKVCALIGCIFRNLNLRSHVRRDYILRNHHS